VAQWLPRKQILELVRAWSLAAPEGWRLELIGETTADPDYAEAVRSAIARSAAPVIVRGAVDDATLVAAYTNAAFFVLPSRFEGYGIVYAEALAYGLPVIACTGGPAPELLGPAGMLVPPDDEPALVAALRRLTIDADLRTRLSSAARARAGALPTWDDTTDHYLAALESARERTR
jgi:glycosyltransferase involved in cell wall biosynthesis